MGKHDSKITRAAHIKHHTVGTSNEISFSVLDAAKNSLGTDGREKTPRFGAISLFTLPGKKKAISTPKKERGLHLPGGNFISTEDSGSSALPTGPIGSIKTQGGSSTEHLSSSGKTSSGGFGGTSSKAPVDEVALKKRLRKTRKFLVTAAAFMVTVAVIGVTGYWLYSNHLIYQDHLAQLDKAITLVTKADETILLMDECVVELAGEENSLLLTEDQRELFSDVRAVLPEAEAQLDNAEILAKSAQAGLTDSVDKEAVGHILQTIQARKDMIAPALLLMEYTVGSANAVLLAQEAWSTLLEADMIAREATAYLIEPTIENLQSSLGKTNEAISKLREAASLFSSVEASCEGSDYGVYQSYIAKRIEALGHAAASDTALIERNKEEALAQNDAYTTADAEAVALAASLPLDPVSLIKDAEPASVRDSREAYNEARMQASESDAFLRDYLGIGV